MIRELHRVVLTKRLEALSLEPGDIGTVVLVHEEERGTQNAANRAVVEDVLGPVQVHDVVAAMLYRLTH